MTDSVLTIRNLQGYYGLSHVLHGVDLDVSRGEVVTIIGHNGEASGVDQDLRTRDD